MRPEHDAVEVDRHRAPVELLGEVVAQPAARRRPRRSGTRGRARRTPSTQNATAAWLAASVRTSHSTKRPPTSSATASPAVHRHVGDDDLDPRLGQRERRRPPQPRRPARDQRDLVAQRGRVGGVGKDAHGYDPGMDGEERDLLATAPAARPAGGHRLPAHARLDRRPVPDHHAQGPQRRGGGRAHPRGARDPQAPARRHRPRAAPRAAPRARRRAPQRRPPRRSSRSSAPSCWPAAPTVEEDEEAHPAYERILTSLAPDEARILRLIAVEGARAAVDVRTWRPLDEGSELVEPRPEHDRPGGRA